MLAEQAVYNAIKHLAATYPDVAPENAALPRIVYQQVGGEVVNFRERSDPGVDVARIQVTCWAKSRAAASTLSKQAEQAIRAATSMQAEPIGARVNAHEPDTGLFGSSQDFRVWSQDT